MSVHTHDPTTLASASVPLANPSMISNPLRERLVNRIEKDEEGVPNLSSGPLGTMQAMRELGIVVDEPLWAHMHAGDCSNCNGGQGCQCGSRATTDQAFALDHSPLTRNRSRVSGALSISW